MSQKTPSEPQRGGIQAAKFYAAPTELIPALGRRGGCKEVAPTELGGGVAPPGQGAGNQTANTRATLDAAMSSLGVAL